MKKILLTLAIACLGIVTNSNAQIIMSQNFHGLTPPAMPSGWTTALTAITGSPALGWQTTTASENFYFANVPNTAPHTEYAVVNDNTDSGNNPASLMSPSFSLLSTTSPYLVYDYFFLGAYYTGPSDQEKAWVDISTDGGTTWAFLDSMNAVSSDWVTHSISLSAYSTYSNCKLRFRYMDAGRWNSGCAVDNIIVVNAQNNDIALTAIAPLAGTPADYILSGSAVTFTGTMMNMSPSTISSYSVTYTVDGGAPVTTPVSASVSSMGTNNFSCTPYTVPSTGIHNVTMWVTETGDPILTNDTMTTSIIGVPFMPTKKLMYEEATGTWCGWCVRGIVFMDSLETLHPGGASEVAVHDADPMTITAYDSWMGGFISGYPSIVVDRNIVDDPSNIIAIYDAHSGDFGYADINMAAYFSGTTVTVPVTINPAVALTGDNRLVLVLTEDKVHGTGLSTWDQHDYYSGGSYGAMNVGGSAGYDFSTLPNPVPAATMYYNHVNRSITPSVLGTSGSAGTLTPGTPFTTSMTATLTVTGTASAPGWQALNMHAIVMLIDGATGHVYNSNNVDLTYPLGVANVNAGITNLNLFPNPANNEVNVVLELKNGSKVNLNITDMSGKVVYTAADEIVAAGRQMMNVSTANLASGVYNVTVTTAEGTATQRLIVAK